MARLVHGNVQRATARAFRRNSKCQRAAAAVIRLNACRFAPYAPAVGRAVYYDAAAAFERNRHVFFQYLECFSGSLHLRICRQKLPFGSGVAVKNIIFVPRKRLLPHKADKRI